jgi:hypothetical protein
MMPNLEYALEKSQLRNYNRERWISSNHYHALPNLPMS